MNVIATLDVPLVEVKQDSHSPGSTLEEATPALSSPALYTIGLGHLGHDSPLPLLVLFAPGHTLSSYECPKYSLLRPNSALLERR